MRTIRTASTVLKRSGQTATQVRALITATVLAVVAGSLILSGFGASSTASSWPHKPSATAIVEKPATSAAHPALVEPVHEMIDLFGDSLGYQAAPYFETLLSDTGQYSVSDNTFGGTATCDWFPQMDAAATQHPLAAVLVFSGNAFTRCMDGVVVRSSEYYALYTTYTEQAIATFSAVGSHVFLVGTPIDATSLPGWDRLDNIYAQLAQADPEQVTYVDAGAAVESPSGGFTWQLPCLSIEPTCRANGTDIVRSPDGTHFCPDAAPASQGVTGPCNEDSPGAFRFALAMVMAVTQWHMPPASMHHIVR